MKKNATNSLDLLERHVLKLKEGGKLESGQGDAAVKALRQMRHALKVANRKNLEKAVSDLARVFLKADVLLSSIPES